MTARRTLPHRLDRIPFFAPVSTPRLRRCWATNLSAGGIGLTGLASSPVPSLHDEELEIEFLLGDTQRTICTTGHVAWTSLVRPDGRISVGCEFRQMRADDQAALALFVANHRPRVLVAMASSEEREHVTRALPHVHLELIDRPDQLDEQLLRSCAAIVVFARELDATRQFLDTIRAGHRQLDFLPLSHTTLFTTLDANLLLPMFNEGTIQEAMRPPLDPQVLVTAVDRACERWSLQADFRWASLQLEAVQPAARRGPPAQATITPTIVHGSAAMQQAYALIRTVASHDVPVLLLGETGTGKELAAREIHRLSNRSHTPYVAQDCGALTETLLESELFGHVRGAFTGATTDHPGLFQIADGGTIFLDEIQNTSSALQAKLMRVVEEGEVRPVGSSKPRRVDVRLIAACNVDLKEAVRERRFRPDFFYRIYRFPIQLPPLREHPEDILPLVKSFLATLSASLGRETHPLDTTDPRVERALLAYRWPGNIRELKNAVERMILLTPRGAPIGLAALPEEVRDASELTGGSAAALEARVLEFERRLIQTALDNNGGVIRRAAMDLDVNAVTLSRKLRRHGLA